MGYVFWNVRIIFGIIVFFNWLMFFLEFRYGGELKEGEEFVIMSIVVSFLFGFGKGILVFIGEFLVFFIFIFEFIVLMIKVRILLRVR